MRSRLLRFWLACLLAFPGLLILATSGIVFDLSYFLGTAGILALLVVAVIHAILLYRFARLIAIDLDFDEDDGSPDEDAVSRGELERLVQVKSQGTLLQRSLRARYGAQRARMGGVAGPSPPTSTYPQRILDRLLEQKRSGIWGPTTPEQSPVVSSEDSQG